MVEHLRTSISFSNPLNLWTRPILDQLAKPLLSQDHQIPCNIVFVCAYAEQVTWNGLPYLASMSPLFQARSNEEQRFTVHLPDYGAGTVRKLLLLICMGASIVKANEVEVLAGLARDLGVRFVKRSFLSFN